jgi:hypothetical protein
MNTLISEKENPRIGDHIVIFPKDENPYEAQILELGETCKLLKDKEGSLSDRIFELPYRELQNVRREYKVIGLTEFTYQSTQNSFLQAELSHVEKTFNITENKIQCFYHFSITDPELFVLPLKSEIAQQIINQPYETIIICHKMYFVEKDFITDGRNTKASFVFHPDSPKRTAFTKRSHNLFTYKEPLE